MLFISLVSSENVITSDRISYGWQDSLQHVDLAFNFFRGMSLCLTVFLTNDKTDFHASHPSYSLHCSYGFFVSVRTYEIITPLYNYMGWCEYNRIFWHE